MVPFGKLMRDERGAALVVALGVVSIMLIIGASAMAMSINSQKTVGHDQQVTASGNVAEAGIDDAIDMAIANYGSYESYFKSSQPTQIITGKQLTDGSGNVTGTYDVWVQQDPNNSNDALFTATGTDGTGSGAQQSTVKVSVFFDQNGFDYTLFHTPPSSANPGVDFVAKMQGTDDDDNNCDGEKNGHGCSNIIITGNDYFGGQGETMGNFLIDSSDLNQNGDDDEHEHGHTGSVTFATYPTNTVSYWGTFGGSANGQLQPQQASAPLPFPTVYFDQVTAAAGASGVTTVTFTASGVPAPQWTRSGNTFNISTGDFQNLYGGKVVELTTSGVNNVTVQITGDCNTNDNTITSTLMIPGVAGGASIPIQELDLIGPDVNLMPTNGLAILAKEGTVKLQNEVNVGGADAGALIYLDGSNGPSELDVSSSGSSEIYGSVVVNGVVNYNAVGWQSGDDDQQYQGKSCFSGQDNKGDDDEDHNTHISSISISYQNAWLNNPKLNQWPWWNSNSGSSVTAFKDNFQRG